MLSFRDIKLWLYLEKLGVVSENFMSFYEVRGKHFKTMELPKY